MGGKQAKMSSTNSSSLNNCSSSNSKDENYRPYKKSSGNGQVKRKAPSSSLPFKQSQSAFHMNDIALGDSVLMPLAASPRHLQEHDANITNNLRFSCPQEVYNSNNKLASPFKRFGLSPRIKRKLVEVISDNKVS
jgi:hypothetical protein